MEDDTCGIYGLEAPPIFAILFDHLSVLTVLSIVSFSGSKNPPESLVRDAP